MIAALLASTFPRRIWTSTCIPPAGTDAVGSSVLEVRQLARRLAELGPVAVGLEASGGYEARLADSLHAAGLKVHILPPGRVRSFARGIGQLAKTDRIDAAMIARHLMAVHAELCPNTPDPARRNLHAITAHRRRLQGERSALVSQLEPLVRAMIEERMASIAQHITRLQATIASLLRPPHLKQRKARLRQITGVGPVLATALLAGMSELGQVSAKVTAALVGVAPYARQSGASDRNGRCTGGRKHLRDIAYMAVLSAIKVKDPILRNFYHRLRARGNPSNTP